MDWIRLFQNNLIPYVTAGPNVGKNNIGFKCPFCGDDDPSHHGGVNLTTNQWSCWRNKEHRGNTPHRLVAALLGISNTQAHLTIQAYTGPNLDSFDALTNPTSVPASLQKPVVMPAEFETIKRNTLTHKFWNYLLDRGFDNPDQVIKDYSLKCCLIGRWKGRLIIPVYGARSSKGEHRTFNSRVEGSSPSEPTIIGWTARSIRTIEGVSRYLESSPAVKRTLFNLQNLDSGECLLIFEGPFDAMKTDYYGKPKVRATCIFGATPTPEQIEILHILSSKFSKLIILLDADDAGITAGFSLSDWLPMATFGNVPEGHKDTDRIDKEQMRKWLDETYRT